MRSARTHGRASQDESAARCTVWAPVGSLWRRIVGFEPFELRPLSRSGLQVTRLGFGTAPIGGLSAPSLDDAGIAMVDHAWRMGVRYFDTAPLYGYGNAERRVGSGSVTQRPRNRVRAVDEGRASRGTGERNPDSVNRHRSPDPPWPGGLFLSWHPAGRPARLRLHLRRRDAVSRVESRTARARSHRHLIHP